jgi:hypothetical protein
MGNVKCKFKNQNILKNNLYDLHTEDKIDIDEIELLLKKEYENIECDKKLSQSEIIKKQIIILKNIITLLEIKQNQLNTKLKYLKNLNNILELKIDNY